MADKRDYYEVLGVDKNADDNTIKKAYRQAAKKYHLDEEKLLALYEKINQLWKKVCKDYLLALE